MDYRTEQNHLWIFPPNIPIYLTELKSDKFQTRIFFSMENLENFCTEYDNNGDDSESKH